jgi:hypothetical protein
LGEWVEALRPARTAGKFGGTFSSSIDDDFDAGEACGLDDLPGLRQLAGVVQG